MQATVDADDADDADDALDTQTLAGNQATTAESPSNTSQDVSTKQTYAPATPPATPPATQTKQADTYFIEFANPHKRLAGEVASKLLKQDSALWKQIQAIRMRCCAANLPCDFRPAHIEVLKNHEKRTLDGEKLAAMRAAELQGRQIALHFQVMDRKAVVIPTGVVSGYGDTHISVAYFPASVSRDQLAQIEKFCCS